VTVDWCTAEDLGTLLDLRPAGPDTWLGIHAVDVKDWGRLYGGQVAAQALRAATLTVADDRLPHSMHGYFLRQGRKDLPVTYEVRRDRDGRSLSARQVTALQAGEVIFSMSCSFHITEVGGTLEPPRPHGLVPPTEAGHQRHRLIDVVEIHPARMLGDRALYSDRMWVRAARRLPDDPQIHACVVLYVSDLGSGFGMVERPDIPSAGPSVDHAMWFQSSARADEWLLLDMVPLKAGGARGVYTGNVWSAEGLVAAFAQEVLLRPAGPA
jgi:acyl-CoA thioesterase-2